MGEIPDQRRHQPGVLTDEFVVVDGFGQQMGPGPRPFHVLDDAPFERVLAELTNGVFLQPKSPGSCPVSSGGGDGGRMLIGHDGSSPW